MKQAFDCRTNVARASPLRSKSAKLAQPIAISMAAMSDVIWQTQVQAPVWSVMTPESLEEQATGWAEPSVDNLLIPEACLHLAVAGTRETARGQGIGACLTRYGLAHARAAGYRCCEADWRSTNLLAARFWPRQGFQPLVYRFVRRVDPRSAWADGRQQV